MRDQARRKSLGDDPVCLLCGESRPAALRAVEGHHVLGRQYEPGVMVPLCRNCHAVQTEKHRTNGIPMQPPLNPIMAAAQRELASSQYHCDLGEAQRKHAHRLLDVVNFLEEDSPGWDQRFQSAPKED